MREWGQQPFHSECPRKSQKKPEFDLWPSSKCQDTPSLWVKAYQGSASSPQLTRKQSIRECAESNLPGCGIHRGLSFKSAADVSYIKLYGMFFSPVLRGGVLGGGWGRRTAYQPKRTAATARVLPSLTTHISKCALGVVFSNPNKKPGRKNDFVASSVSIPWNICRHGDPSPDFLTLQDGHLSFQPACLHPCCYLLSLSIAVFFLFLFPDFCHLYHIYSEFFSLIPSLVPGEVIPIGWRNFEAWCTELAEKSQNITHILEIVLFHICKWARMRCVKRWGSRFIRDSWATYLLLELDQYSPCCHLKSWRWDNPWGFGGQA